MTNDSWDSEHAERVGLPVTPIKPPAPHRMPERKVAAAGVSGAVAVLVVYVATVCGLEVPASVSAAVATLAAFVGGYVKRG